MEPVGSCVAYQIATDNARAFDPTTAVRRITGNLRCAALRAACRFADMPVHSRGRWRSRVSLEPARRKSHLVMRNASYSLGVPEKSRLMALWAHGRLASRAKETPA